MLSTIICFVVLLLVFDTSARSRSPRTVYVHRSSTMCVHIVHVVRSVHRVSKSISIKCLKCIEWWLKPQGKRSAYSCKKNSVEKYGKIDGMKCGRLVVARKREDGNQINTFVWETQSTWDNSCQRWIGCIAAAFIFKPEMLKPDCTFDEILFSIFHVDYRSVTESIWTNGRCCAECITLIGFWRMMLVTATLKMHFALTQRAFAIDESERQREWKMAQGKRKSMQLTQRTLRHEDDTIRYLVIFAQNSKKCNRFSCMQMVCAILLVFLRSFAHQFYYKWYHFDIHMVVNGRNSIAVHYASSYLHWALCDLTFPLSASTLFTEYLYIWNYNKCNIGIASNLRHRCDRDVKPVISVATSVNYLWHNRVQVAKELQIWINPIHFTNFFTPHFSCAFVLFPE